MDVRVELQVSTEGVNDQHDGRSVAKFILGMLENGSQCSLNQDVEAHFSVDLNNGPQKIWNGKDDMLVWYIEEMGLISFNPIIGLNFTAS